MAKSKAGEDDLEFGEEGIFTLSKLPHIDGTDRKIKGLCPLPDGELLIGVSVSHDPSPNPKKVLEAYYGLARLTDKGELDEGFAEKGFQYGQFKDGFDAAGGKVAVYESRIYMQGATTLRKDVFDPPQHLVLSRFDNNGNLDKAFANQGSLILQNRDEENCMPDTCNIAVQTDGKPIISATYHATGAPEKTHAVLYRMTAKGTLDTSFATGGRLDIKLGNSVNVTSVLAMQVRKSGKILVAGDITESGNKLGYFARFNSDGSPDKTFGSAAKPGFHVLNVEYGNTTLQGLTENDDGFFFGLGKAERAGKVSGIIVKMQEGGTPDPQFNNGQPLVTRLVEGQGDSWFAGFVDSEDRITVSGSDLDTHIARFRSNGKPDTDFGKGGFVTRDSSATPLSIFLRQRLPGKFVFAGDLTGVGGPLGTLWGLLG